MSASEDEHSHDPEQVQASMRGYMTGFVLAVILTVIPFWLVMGEVLANPAATIAIIIALGAVQMFVHLIYFLHIDAKGEAGWNLLSLLFSGTLIVIVLVGSLWIMFHLEENTHPTPSEMRYMP